jgi:hypothetical protein
MDRSAPVLGRSEVERSEMPADSAAPERADVAAAEDGRTPRPPLAARARGASGSRSHHFRRPFCGVDKSLKFPH